MVAEASCETNDGLDVGIVLLIIFTSFHSVSDMLGVAERDIVCDANSDIDKRFLSAICSPVANVVESTLPINPHAAQFAAYRLP